MSILKHFPFGSFRPHQEEILVELQDNFDSYNYFFLEAPTGFGKSAVAYSLAKWILSRYGGLTHFCVVDKYLQQQYLDSFTDLRLVKGRGNFLCPYNPLGEITCDKAMCALIRGYDCPHKPKVARIETLLGSMPLKDGHGVVYDWDDVDATGVVRCPYWDQKDKGIRADVTIHNYHYFLYEQNFAHSFTKRMLGVFDEAHIAENILMGFVEKLISLRVLNRIWQERYPDERFKFSIPFCRDADSWVEWLEEVQVTLQKLHAYYEDLMKTDPKGEETATKHKRYKDTLERLEGAIQNLREDPDNWVWLRDDYRVVFKPVTIKEYSEFLFSHVDKKLLMSATILDANMLAEYLGINEEIKYLRVDESTFPVENRLIVQDHQGKATHKTMTQYLPKMLERIDKYYIPSKGINKGVIHTHTHKIAKFILDNSEHNSILMSNTGSEEKREDIFQKFFGAPPPKVMVTPSMRLGIDLYDDRCRWQILCKVPYPDLGDPQIRKRLEIDADWYDWMTLMSLIQTYGRGCRSETDFCETFILDTMFVWLISKNKNILPKWFVEAIRRRSEYD